MTKRCRRKISKGIEIDWGEKKVDHWKEEIDEFEIKVGILIGRWMVK